MADCAWISETTTVLPPHVMLSNRVAVAVSRTVIRFCSITASRICAAASFHDLNQAFA
jgi:hypothetical protein